MLFLTKVRIEQGFSKAKLARLSDIDAGMLSKIEAGRFIPYPKQLERIARALNISLKNSQRLLETEGKKRNINIIEIGE